MLHGWHIRARQKGGDAVGRGRKGKGTTPEVIVAAPGIPIGLVAAPANVHEVGLVGPAPDEVVTAGRPERLIGDRACAGDGLRTALAERGTEAIIPHRRNRRRPPIQDGRALRRHARRWRIERFLAWLKPYRRVAVRHVVLVGRFVALVHLACAMIILRKYYNQL